MTIEFDGDLPWSVAPPLPEDSPVGEGEPVPGAQLTFLAEGESFSLRRRSKDGQIDFQIVPRTQRLRKQWDVLHDALFNGRGAFLSAQSVLHLGLRPSDGLLR